MVGDTCTLTKRGNLTTLTCTRQARRITRETRTTTTRRR